MTKPHAVIIGGGVAGLAAAWWLDKAGWQSTIIERAKSLRNKGYMVSLTGLGYETVKKMDLYDRLKAISYTIDENIYKNSKGKELIRLHYRDFVNDLPYLAVRRSDLVTVLADALPVGAKLCLDTYVLTLEKSADGYRIDLNNHDILHCNMVLGCDGLRSSLRQQYFDRDGKSLQPLGYCFAVYDINHVKDFDYDFLSYVEPRHFAEYYSLHDGKLAALHIWRDERSNPHITADGYQLLKEIVRESNRQVRELLSIAQKEASPILVDSLTMVDLPEWYNGKMLLLGDAAHCLTLISGQGAGMALASSEMLGNALAKYQNIEQAFTVHDRQLRPIIRRLQERTRKMAPMFVPATAFTFHLRNIVLKFMPKSWLYHYFTNAVKSEIALTHSQ